jgi:hypothetical protein
MAEPTTGASHKFPSDLSERELGTLLAAAKIKRETTKLQARFLSTQPMELTSRIQVCKPKKTIDVSRRGGAYCSSFQSLEKTVYLSILLASEDKEPISKNLTLTSTQWAIGQRYLLGSAGSDTISVSAKYGDAEGKAVVSGYNNPNGEIDEFSEGGFNRILRGVIGDLGGGSDLGELELLEMLLSNFLKTRLDARIFSCPSLRKVIKEELTNKF